MGPKKGRAVVRVLATGVAALVADVAAWSFRGIAEEKGQEDTFDILEEAGALTRRERNESWKPLCTNMALTVESRPVLSMTSSSPNPGS